MFKVWSLYERAPGACLLEWDFISEDDLRRYIQYYNGKDWFVRQRLVKTAHIAPIREKQ